MEIISRLSLIFNQSVAQNYHTSIKHEVLTSDSKALITRPPIVSLISISYQLLLHLPCSTFFLPVVLKRKLRLHFTVFILTYVKLACAEGQFSKEGKIMTLTET